MARLKQLQQQNSNELPLKPPLVDYHALARNNDQDKNKNNQANKWMGPEKLSPDEKVIENAVGDEDAARRQQLMVSSSGKFAQRQCHSHQVKGAPGRKLDLSSSHQLVSSLNGWQMEANYHECASKQISSSSSSSSSSGTFDPTDQWVSEERLHSSLCFHV